MSPEKNYTVYFEFYNRKMKAKVLATSEADAKEQIAAKIIFHKTIVDEKDEFNQVTDMLDELLDIFGGKKK